MKRSVAILHYAGPPNIGGVEITMAAHARVMAADGWHVRVLTGRGDWQHPDVETIMIPELGSRGTELEQIARELVQGTVSPLFKDLTERIVRHLEHYLAGIDVAIVHNVLSLHKNQAFTTALYRLQQSGRAPRLLAWCHDFAWLDPLYTPELHAGEPWELLRYAWPGVQYVVVSEDRREMLAGLFDLPRDAVTVATPGIDLVGFLKLEPDTVALVNRLDLLHADPLLLLPARITRRKNIEQAIAIVGALRTRGLHPKLIVTGPPGPHNPTNAAYLAQLQALRDASGARDAVVFLYETYVDEQGNPLPVSDAMLADWYRLADGLLFPSRYEGFGIPVLEAGMAGIPIFCSDIPPFRTTVGDTAFYFDLSAAPEDIATQIAAVVRDDRRGQLRRRVRLDYTWEALYQQVILPLLIDNT
ncbi:MAG: glycosyltransferase [Chloroflexi bacterium AL-W]|nr:glycosyltransferase [Chloroflexi bacterium AL-N1]NOK69026.1 glycosyltransferase [Chloroflexi bacterium AL-N10]NOK77009.1 glycosyltransferase [Chloroflexi bacterium AL-N5]NOK82603.1 glycosyltransferase [Chloroflexi bacterium AL-W]NOK90866.1 glycosyltransferase [Chloroflexi bacterium AL-N15]